VFSSRRPFAVFTAWVIIARVFGADDATVHEEIRYLFRIRRTQKYPAIHKFGLWPLIEEDVSIPVHRIRHHPFPGNKF